MASLVLGAIGGFMFGPIGFLGGSLLGNLLFPGKQEGPRLTNLKLQGSDYGRMIPIPYGTIRLSGQVVWQTDLTEHKHTSGGKGGPQVTTYTYSASFAVKICKGPIAGVLTIWANGEVIYDTTGNFPTVDNSQIPITIYLGAEGTAPDPTMESILGVGNVPAFQDDAAVVFTDWDLGNFGNTLPNLSFLVFATGGPIPFRVSTFDNGIHNASPGHSTTFAGVTYDATSDTLTAIGYTQTGMTYHERYWHPDGTSAGTALDTTVPAPAGDIESAGGYSDGFLMSGYNPPGGGVNSAWFYEDALVRDLGGLYWPTAVFPAGSSLCKLGNYLYATGGGAVTRWPLTGNIPAAAFDKVYNTIAAGVSDIHLCPGDNGLLYVHADGVGPTTTALYEFNPDLTINRSWLRNQLPSDFFSGSPSGATFVVYHGMICYADNLTGLSGHFQLYQIEAPGTAFNFLGNVPVATSGAAQSGITRFHNGLVLTADGVISLDPPQEPVTLRSIVEDLSTRSGLNVSTDVDATALTQLVDGYMITTRADARTDLDPLRSAYYFDAVEQSGKAVFVNRGASSALTIPDNDLAAQELGQQPPPLVEIDRAQEIDLPVSVNVTYIDDTAAYQNGAQQAIRQTVLAQSVADVQLPIAMSPQKGRQIANVQLYETWTERMSFKFQTSRKYLYLEPTDVVTVHGYVMRIDRKTATVAGLVQFEGKASNPALYIVALAANPTSGAQQPSASASQPTNLLLLDLPLLVDTDFAPGVYAAAAGSVDETWKGYTLYKSSDGGSSYNQVAAASVANVIGTVSDALPPFAGGNMVDEINTFEVVVGAGGGDLSGIDLTAMLNGGNVALVGNELLQFRDATLTAPSTYTCAGLLRGRRGTEFEMTTHIAGERFVLLPATDVGIPFSELGVDRIYKPVTTGGNLSTAQAQHFLSVGIPLRPYAPVLVRGAADAGTGDIVIVWTRRTRIGGAWADYTDVPLSEPSELYVLQVWDATFTICARVVTGITSPTFTYTGAMQVTDFGANQQTVYVTVAQVGTFGLGAQAYAVLAGAGGSVDAPLSPQQPYNTLPPPNPPSTGCSAITGTVTTFNPTWTAGVQQFFTPSDFGPADAVVVVIDVPASPGAYVVNVAGAEFNGPPTPREAAVSLSPCGVPVQPSMQTIGSLGFSWTMRSGVIPNPQKDFQLQPSTKYYITVTTDAVSEMIINYSQRAVPN